MLGPANRGGRWCLEDLKRNKRASYSISKNCPDASPFAKAVCCGGGEWVIEMGFALERIALGPRPASISPLRSVLSQCPCHRMSGTIGFCRRFRWGGATRFLREMGSPFESWDFGAKVSQLFCLKNALKVGLAGNVRR